MEYFDPKKNELKGTILLNKKTKTYVKTNHVFVLAKPEREFVFNCLDVPASRWVEEIRKILLIN